MLICCFDTEGIMHKEFVPPGQTVNGKFYCNVLRWMRENIKQKCPDKWHIISWACTMITLRLTHRSLWGSYWLLRTRLSSPTLPTHWTSPPVIFPVPKDEIEAQRVTFWQQWRYPEQHRMWWRRWCGITFSSASDHGNPAGIALSMQKGITSKGMEVNKNSVSG